MELKNKETGIIHEVSFYENNAAISFLSLENGYRYFYGSLKDFNNDWEDAPEEPKRDYYYIDYNGTIKCFQYLDFDWQEEMKQIGNYFESKEEAEKAVEKLKAFKRLKANGFKFTDWGVGFNKSLVIKAKYTRGQIYDDMNLLFGGEE